MVPPLKELADPGTVRLLDAAVLHKDAVPAFDDLDGDVLELLSDEDLIAIAASLAPDMATLVLKWKNRWAAGFAEAVRRAGGMLAEYDPHPVEDPSLDLDGRRVAGELLDDPA